MGGPGLHLYHTEKYAETQVFRLARSYVRPAMAKALTSLART